MDGGTVIITLNHFWYFVAGIGVLAVGIIWYNGTLMQDVFEDAWKIMDSNRKLIIEIGILKAMLKAKGHDIN